MVLKSAIDQPREWCHGVALATTAALCRRCAGTARVILPSRTGYDALRGGLAVDGIGINAMTDDTGHFNSSDDEVPSFATSDEAIEAAAGPARGAAVSMAGAISVNVMCCGGDIH
jgi:hypothetical protein